MEARLGPARFRVRSAVVGALCGCLSATALAAGDGDRPAPGDGDRYSLTVHADTHAELFRERDFPGVYGAKVPVRTRAPVLESVVLRARAIDSPFDVDALDVEISAWMGVLPRRGESGESADGDVQTAYVRYRRGPVALVLGRQHVAGGAARYSRFDGADVSADVGSGFVVEAYGGQTVLPRWDEQPGYYVLGAPDEVLADPEALPPPERSGYWLSGARVGFARGPGEASLSFHEQRERGGVAFRTAAADARAALVPEAALGASTLFELDAGRVSEARLFVDVSPQEALDVSAELRRMEPALLLSRQSVLSVFSADAHDEAGVLVTVRPIGRLTLEGAGYFDRYDRGRAGGRSELTLRLTAGRSRRTVVRLGHVRLVAPDNGYHALRASLAHELAPRLVGTVEAYSYIYDERIRGYAGSTMYVGTAGYALSPEVKLLAFTQVARSPYAALDARAGLRLSMDFDFSTVRDGS